MAQRKTSDEGSLPERRSAPRDAAILVVDDEAEQRRMLRAALEEAGFHVDTAEHGGEALACLSAGPPPDLILLDLRMPVLDGWALAAELKARPALAAIPVVVMSGAGDTVLNLAPVSAGYLSKPFDLERLLETVEGALLRRRRRSGVTERGDGGG